MRPRHLALLSLTCVLWSCGSAGGPSEPRSLPLKYEHTFDFMWDEVRALLKSRWCVANESREERMLETAWDVQLSPMAQQGQRHRLRVFIEGEDGAGYEVRAEQETEKNDNDENPLLASDADWKGVSSDGALADRFLVALARRLHPEMDWKIEAVR